MSTTDPKLLDVIVKAYDVRGTVPEQLNVDVAHALGVAFARFVGAPRVLVGRDMRPSGPELVQAFVRGVNEQGVDVIDLGLTSTDLVYFAAGSLDAPRAMFTASHNPAQYNGVKFCLSGARAVGQDTGLAAIKSTAAEVLSGQGPAPASRAGSTTNRNLLSAFADHVVSFIDASSMRPLRVVADTANGMGGLVVPAVMERLPNVTLEVMYGEPDGTFPNHPAEGSEGGPDGTSPTPPADPLQPANQRDLQARVVSGGFDVGLAFDGDADRVFVVDETGRGLSGSTTTALLAAAILRTHPGATVLHNLICSKAVPEVIRENGGVPIRTKVGHSFIKQIMAETGAVFGGEHSAHYYFRDNYGADSGLIASVLVLNEISRADTVLSVLRKPFERYSSSGEINTHVNDPDAVMMHVAEKYSDQQQDRLDGLTVDSGSWWFNLRPSKTEPLLRLNLEARTRDDCNQRVAEVLALVTSA